MMGGGNGDGDVVTDAEANKDLIFLFCVYIAILCHHRSLSIVKSSHHMGL